MIPKFLLLSIPVLLALAAARTGPAPRLDAWRILGPGGGGTMLAPTVSPHDPNLVVEHCDMTGAYITLDGGNSWRMFNLRTVVNTFAYDAADPNVIYAGNAALWRSEDRGRSWSMVFPDPKKKTVEYQVGDHADFRLSTADAAYPAGRSISAIAVNAKQPRQIFVAFGGWRATSALLFRSDDRGASWTRVHEFPGTVLEMAATPDGLTVATTGGLHRLDGEAWRTLTAPGKLRAASIATDGPTGLVYATTEDGQVLVSRGMAAWEVRTPKLGQQSGGFEAVGASARNGQVAYVGFRALKLGEGPANLFNGIAKTTDGGRTWAIVHIESNRASENLEPSWIESRAPDGGQDIWFDAPQSLGVAPGNPDICYATDLFRTYRTLDGGKTWRQVNSVRAENGRWTTRGLDVTTNYGVHFDPFDRDHMFIDYTDIGGFHSYDRGATWETATNGVPGHWRNTTYWLALDPEVRGLVWGAFSGVHDLPRPKMWRDGRDPHGYVGGVGMSTDGGKTWTKANAGMPETAVTHILLDPASAKGRRTLYASAYGRGVYKSVDGGRSWTLKNAGITEAKPFAWRITRADNGTLYLVVARSNDGRYGERGDGALYRSTDGAEHWTKMALPAGTNGPMAVTLDPRDNRRMYLSAWGQERKKGVDTGGGVFLSTDAGGSWKPIFQQRQHVYDVTVDPRNPDVIYNCGFDASAWRSADAGQTWTRIRGYNFKWGHRVVPDPNDASKIYITTYGGSVWHGPAEGDPKAPEDIATPVPVAE